MPQQHPSAPRKSLFKHPLLERLSRTYISVPLSIYAVGCSILLYIGFDRAYFNIAQGVSTFLGGILFWSIFEYMAHRYIFHMLPTNRVKERIQYVFHGIHHDFPRDTERLAMPPAASLLILTALFFIYRWIMGGYVYAFLPGFVMGYSLYLFIHYAVHAYKPPKNFLKALWINHSIHHYKNDEVAFGVSSPLWDVLLGTLPEKTYRTRSHKQHKGKNSSQERQSVLN